MGSSLYAMIDKLKTVFGRKALRQINEMAARSQITGQRVESSPNGTTVLPAARQYMAREFPWLPTITFGLERTGNAKIKVLNCKARRYADPQGSSIYYVCSDTEVTFTGAGDGQRICWKWNPTAGLSILTAPQVNDPLDDSTYIYGVVAVFDVSASLVATLATGGSIQCGQVITLPTFTVAGA